MLHLRSYKTNQYEKKISKNFPSTTNKKCTSSTDKELYGRPSRNNVPVLKNGPHVPKMSNYLSQYRQRQNPLVKYKNISKKKSW